MVSTCSGPPNLGGIGQVCRCLSGAQSLTTTCYRVFVTDNSPRPFPLIAQYENPAEFGGCGRIGKVCCLCFPTHRRSLQVCMKFKAARTCDAYEKKHAQACLSTQTCGRLSPFGLARLITYAQWYTSERKLRLFAQVCVILVGAPY